MNSVTQAVLATSLLGWISAQAANEANAAEALSQPSTASGLLVGKFPGETAYDQIWSGFTLYKDENNPILQEFAIQGRLQVQYADGHSSNGHFDIEDYKNSGKDESVWGDHFEARRAYFGFKSKWFQNWKFEGQIDVDTDGMDGDGGNGTLYKDIYDLYLTYAPSDPLSLSIGKREVQATREQEISSKDIVTLERSVVANMVHPGNLTGIWASGKGIGGHWIYELGVYGNDQQREFSDFDAGAIMLGKVGYDYSSAAGMDSAVMTFRWMHNTKPGYQESRIDPNFRFSASPPYTATINLSNELLQGRFGLTADLVYGFGDSELGQPDVMALNVIPTYFIAKGLQLVGRLQLASSSDADGVGLQSRYESVSPDVNPLTGKRTSDSKGNTYVSIYAGLNYYLYGNKLKLMNGVEYSHLGGGGYDGITFYGGLRFAF